MCVCVCDSVLGSLSSALSVSSAASGKLPVKLLKGLCAWREGGSGMMSAVGWSGHFGAIYCLEGAGKLLASGGADQISVWKWEELVKGSKVGVFLCGCMRCSWLCSQSVRPVSSLQPPSW